MSAASLSGYSREYSPPLPLYVNGAAPAERPTRGPASMHFSLRDVIASLALLAACSFAQADELRTLKGLASPESAIVGRDVRIYVSEIGGLARDAAGILYLSDWKGGRVWKLDPKRSGAKPEQYAQTFQSAADIGLSADGKYILVPDMKAGVLYWMPK